MFRCSMSVLVLRGRNLARWLGSDEANSDLEKLQVVFT